MKPYEKIRIVFDGPPSHKSGRFIEVENEHAQSVSFGEWVEEGELWYLEFPNPANLESENEALGKILERLADWIERINDDPFGALTDGYPSPEKMIVYLRQRAWEVNLLDALLAGKETP